MGSARLKCKRTLEKLADNRVHGISLYSVNNEVRSWGFYYNLIFRQMRISEKYYLFTIKVLYSLKYTIYSKVSYHPNVRHTTTLIT